MKHYETLEHAQLDAAISVLVAVTSAISALGTVISAPRAEFLAISAIALLV